MSRRKSGINLKTFIEFGIHDGPGAGIDAPPGHLSGFLKTSMILYFGHPKDPLPKGGLLTQAQEDQMGRLE